MALEELQGHFGGNLLEFWAFCHLSGAGDAPGALKWQKTRIETFLPLRYPDTLPLHPFRRFDTIDLH